MKTKYNIITILITIAVAYIVNNFIFNATINTSEFIRGVVICVVGRIGIDTLIIINK